MPEGQAPQQLEVLLNSFQLKCRGADEDGKRFFEAAELAEPIIVKVYKDGRTQPLCRHCERGYVVARCNPAHIKVKTEDELGICPYASKS